MTSSALLLTAFTALCGFLAVPASAELTVSQIKDCATGVNGKTDDLFKLSEKESGARYIFEGSAVYKITLPPDGSFVKLDSKIFPNTRGLCYSTERLYSREPSEMNDGDLKHCQKTPAIGFEKLSGVRLNEAFEAIMDGYRTSLQEQYMFSAGADGKIDSDTVRGQSSELQTLGSFLDDCGKINPLSSYAFAKYEAAQKEMDKAFSAYGLTKNAPIKWHTPHKPAASAH